MNNHQNGQDPMDEPEEMSGIAIVDSLNMYDSQQYATAITNMSQLAVVVTQRTFPHKFTGDPRHRLNVGDRIRFRAITKRTQDGNQANWMVKELLPMDVIVRPFPAANQAMTSNQQRPFTNNYNSNNYTGHNVQQNGYFDQENGPHRKRPHYGSTQFYSPPNRTPYVHPIDPEEEIKLWAEDNSTKEIVQQHQFWYMSKAHPKDKEREMEALPMVKARMGGQFDLRMTQRLNKVYNGTASVHFISTNVNFLRCTSNPQLFLFLATRVLKKSQIQLQKGMIVSVLAFGNMRVMTKPFLDGRPDTYYDVLEMKIKSRGMSSSSRLTAAEIMDGAPPTPLPSHRRKKEKKHHKSAESSSSSSSSGSSSESEDEGRDVSPQPRTPVPSIMYRSSSKALPCVPQPRGSAINSGDLMGLDTPPRVDSPEQGELYDEEELLGDSGAAV